MPPQSLFENPFFQILITLTLIAVGSYFAMRRFAPGEPLLLHSHNLDLCIGCAKCEEVCPTSVLEMDLATHKVKIARFDDCISCRSCESVCPTKSLVMHYEHEEPTRLTMPELDEYYQCVNRPGMYLIGHAAGVPQIKNAVNCGRAVIEHMLRPGGLSPAEALPPGATPDSAVLDVAIVGSGPGGLSAAMSCAAKQLRFKIFERATDCNYTIATYPVGKTIHPDPPEVKCVGLLPVYPASKEELLHEWKFHMTEKGLGRSIVKPAEVKSISPPEDARPHFLLTVQMKEPPFERVYRAKRVVLAIGGFGELRRPEQTGGELTLPQLDDPKKYKGKLVLVMGGGDTAVQAAVQLSQECRKVVFLYRKSKDEMRASKQNIANLELAAEENKLVAYYQSEALCYEKKDRDKIIATLKIPARKEKDRGDVRPTTIDTAFACFGPKDLEATLTRLGVTFKVFEHQEFRRAPTDKLVEGLLAQVLVDNNEPTRPQLPDEADQELSGATVVDRDISSLMKQVISARTLANRTEQELAEDAKLISQHFRIPGPHALMPPTEKAEIADPLPPVREQRSLRHRFLSRSLRRRSRQ